MDTLVAREALTSILSGIDGLQAIATWPSHAPGLNELPMAIVHLSPAERAVTYEGPNLGAHSIVVQLEVILLTEPYADMAEVSWQQLDGFLSRQTETSIADAVQADRRLGHKVSGAAVLYAYEPGVMRVNGTNYLGVKLAVEVRSIR